MGSSHVFKDRHFCTEIEEIKRLHSFSLQHIAIPKGLMCAVAISAIPVYSVYDAIETPGEKKQ
jgi:hypothetical protein